MPTATRPNVALVDDDDDARDALKQLLKTHGVTVTPFANSEDFLTALDEKSFQCLLVAERGPDTPGSELRRTLVEKRVPVPVIVLAERLSLTLAVEALKAGAVDVLERPYDGPLVASIRQALAMSEQWHKNVEERRDVGRG